MDTVALSQVIEKFASLQVQAAKLLVGIKKSEVDDLKRQLRLIRAVLRDAEQPLEDPDELVKKWVEALRDVASLMEDVIDEHDLILNMRQWRQNQRRFVNFLSRAGRLAGTLSSRRNLASNLVSIKELLLEIQQRRRLDAVDDRDGRRLRAVDWTHPHRHAYFNEKNTVGIDSATSELVRRLIEGEYRRSVVSLVGVGGIGKTTLAKKVYDTKEVIVHFDCCVFIFVTQWYKMEEVLRTVAKRIGAVGEHDHPERIEAMEMNELIGSVRDSLGSKRRYLLVFDDVWDEKFWRVVKCAMPDDGNGSRVIITTRSDTVAACSNETSSDYVKRLEPLSMSMSLDLFIQRVFRGERNQSCPQELENLCHEFVRMCGGLPLAIVVVANWLSTREKTVFEWQNLLQNCQFGPNSENVLRIVSKVLALSFRALPDNLKELFVYFSIFPKDSLIANDKLVKLWIAEGFIQEKQGMTLEQVAEEHLAELICRNMVQAFEGSYLEKFCGVHCLMHEMARQKADEYHFCHIRAKRSSNFRGKSRRLSINNDDTRNVLETIDDSQVRSVFLSNIKSLDNSFLITLFGKHKLLTLLDFDNVPLERLPEEVGNLLNMKYLSLQNTKVKRLPKSVGKLQKLQTLDVRNTMLVELPISINEIQNLRHLLASVHESEGRLDSNKGVRMKEGIRYLVNLQTLMSVQAHLSGINVIQELKKLRQLRSLSISSLTSELASALCACIEEMSLLESLSLYSKNKHENLDIENISSPPPRLNRLVLKGLLQSFPQWIFCLQNLSVLCLSQSRLADDPLKYLCLLPKLESLWLYQAYEGKQLHFKEGGFEKLKLLALRELSELEAVEIEEGALSSLQELRIGPSPCLHEVPSGIRYLSSLEALSLYDMPNEFALGLQPEGGSDYGKIEHVPSVLFWYRVQGRNYISYKLGDMGLLDRLQGLATSVNEVNHYDFRLSFSYSDDEDSSASTSAAQWDDIPRLSSSSDQFSFFTDDVEE